MNIVNKNILNKNCLSINGEISESLELSKSIFDVAANNVVMYEVTRWHMSKNRQGTHSTKGVSDVAGSTKKSRPQKESGKSRQGDGREPHFRGGGVCFGPKPRSHAFSVNKKVRRLALKMAISKKVSSDKLVFLNNVADHSSHKTSDFKLMLNSVLKKSASSKILFVANDFSEEFKMGASNVYNVNLLKFAGLNTYSILKHEFVVFDKGVLEAMKGWN